MMTKEIYLHDAEAMDALSVRMSQLHALSRVLEDTSRTSERDDQSFQTSLWLLSDLLAETTDEFTSLHKRFINTYRPGA